MRKITGGFIKNCESDESLNNFKSSVNGKRCSKYSVETVKKFNPHLMEKNLETQDVQNNETLFNEIHSLNKLNKNFTLNGVKIVVQLQFCNSFNIILKVSTLLRTSLLSIGFMYIIWKK